MTPSRKVVMSGMRPTGRLHLGNHWGALRNWVSLQESYDCWFMVADWHMLTSGYDDTSRLRDNVREMVLDWLAAGIDPERCVVFQQSRVPQHAELTLLLSMITPLSWLENCPTWKEQLQELARTKESLLREQVSAAQSGQASAAGGTAVAESTAAQDRLRTHGHLGYPALQTADIVLYGTEKVPVGQDQLPHLELSREIARRFNQLYAKDAPVLVEPQPLLTATPKVQGLDGRKMSKSYGNAIDLFETEASLKTKVMAAYTDPTRSKATDPGHPEPCPENPPGCSVYSLHQLYSGHWQARGEECRAGKIGCVACKKDLLGSLAGPFDEFRRRREGLADSPGRVEEILERGSARARERAERTLDGVRRAMRLR